MNIALETIYNRRSIRKYKETQISDSELEQILKAGVCAPSGKNLQSAVIIAVQNREELALLSRMNAKLMGTEADPFYGAPTALVVLAEAGSKYAVQDGSLVMGNLLLAAEALGLGSCWINRAEEVFASEEGRALLRKWGLDGDYIGIGNCIVGYKDEKPEMKPRKENYVYYVR